MLRLAPTPPGDHFLTPETLRFQPCYPLHVLQCLACGHAQLDTVVPPEAIYSGYLYATSHSPGFDRYLRSVAHRIVASVPLTADDLVLDIGSNDGTLLRAFAEVSGARVHGVDPAAQIAATADVPTTVGWWTPDTARHVVATVGQAKLITAVNVFANVDDLDSFMAAIHVALEPHGIFVIETGHWPSIVRGHGFETIEHEHLSYFSLRSLRQLANKYGYRLLRAEHTPSKGGCIRVYLQREDVPIRDITIWSGDDRWIESQLEVECPTDTVQRDADELFTRLYLTVEDIVGAGHSVYAYGASVGGTTLLYAAGLNGLVAAVLDDNPVRHGFVTPGAHLPVRPSAAIANTEHVVVLAWRYFDQIQAKHRAWKGRFIVPLPAIRMVSNR